MPDMTLAWTIRNLHKCFWGSRGCGPCMLFGYHWASRPNSRDSSTLDSSNDDSSNLNEHGRKSKFSCWSSTGSRTAVCCLMVVWGSESEQNFDTTIIKVANQNSGYGLFQMKDRVLWFAYTLWDLKCR